MFEYKIIYTWPADILEEKLNSLANEGYRVCTIIPPSPSWDARLILERKIPSSVQTVEIEI
jgi:hypothetical protein